MNYKDEYNQWLDKADLMLSELKQMSEEEIEDAFYRNLTFGTGGLRGMIGAGTNRMNEYVVAKASQGLADYVIKHYPKDKRRIAVSYDSRIKSDLFAQVASGVFAANEIEVYIYPQLMPTPCLSFAVRELKCAAGIMITASHNPAKYNGYKVYGDDGCQITTEAAKEILAEIDKLDIFSDINKMTFEDGISKGSIKYIKDDVYTAFIENVKKQSVLVNEDIGKDVSIVYSPLNGTGLKPVMRALNESGFTNITVVKEQENPDGSFPTCPYPNPEIKEALKLGLKYAKEVNADLMLATDPDCDRVGIAVKNKEGEHVLVSGNEVGALLLDYICDRRIANGTMPEKPVFVKTIVTTDLGEQIASHYGVKTINVLTGFKYIGEQIGLLEKQDRVADYICGFEESYGYLTGTYVRDKDAVNGAFMICEMFAYYKSKGISLLEKLDELYKTYGYRLNELRSYQFNGSIGFERMNQIMTDIRDGKFIVNGYKIARKTDYLKDNGDLPKSNVIKYEFIGGSSVVIRPSGTEPKLKLYSSITAANHSEANMLNHIIVEAFESIFEK